MRLARHPQLDALCGEYLLGTLRGHARLRFERALREEPLVARRADLLVRTYVPRASEAQALAPRTDGWQRLQRELDLADVAPPWYRRVIAGIASWQWATAAAAAVALSLALTLLRPTEEFTAVARLVGENAPIVTAAVSSERRTLELRATQPTTAPAGRSYEVWLLPAEGGAPVSLGVLTALDARVTLPAAQAPRLRTGAKLAVSVEPAGGSPTGAPTGPVILVGEIG